MIWNWCKDDLQYNQDNMSVRFISPYSPLLYSEIGVYKGIQNFPSFAQKTLNCWYSLEPPHSEGSNVYSQYMF